MPRSSAEEAASRSYRMAKSTALIDIQRGQYTLSGIDEGPRGIRSDGNGLFVSELGRDASVSTGTADGPLRLTVETCSQAPPLELEGWEDVVEVSQRCDDTGGVAVAPLFEGPLEELPHLTVAPGSSIRIRVHARGRDEASKYIGVDEPIEEHLLQMWPAPEAEEVCHRLSDGYGEIMRAQWSDESARIRLASGFARVDIRAGTYALAGVDAGPKGIRSAGSGLFVSDSDGARILTGTAEGQLRLTLEEYAEAPPLRLEGWDEIVEVSQRSDTGEVAVPFPFLTYPIALPKVRVSPGGLIRLRIHGRGRDEAATHERVYEPVEEHLLQMWPAPEAEEVWHRLSDAFGESVRSQWSARQ
jgi:hypothetical protein